MRVLVVKVRRNELNEQRVDVPPHELPLLGYVHGEENCKVLGELIVDRDMPHPSEEYSRLAQRYGRDKANESLEPRVAAVYGIGPIGERRLGEAMEWGQREDLTLADFQLSGGEPAHGSPQGLIPMRSTQIRPQAHSGPQRGKKKQRAAPRLATPREGASAAGVAQMPAAMRPGVASEKRAGTAKQKRAASGAAGGSGK